MTRAERKLVKLRDERDDESSYLYKWMFSMAPSEIRKRKAKIEELDRRIRAAVSSGETE